jgi:hypothetical protein
MRLFLSLLLAISIQAFLCAETNAQTQTSTSSITVNDRFGEEEGATVCGGYVIFTANVANIAADKPTFNWTASWGRIIKGQGTRTIKVDSGPSFGYELTVTVEIGGVAALSTPSDRRVSRTVRVMECFCPTISISCPADAVKPGDPATVSVNISGGNPHANPLYKWEVSAGKIISGQGTPTISIDTAGAEGQSITATVEVNGFETECEKVKSCSLSPYEGGPPPTQKFDEYGEVNVINEETRLNNYGIELERSPGSSGYIIIYGPRGVNQYLTRVRKFLVETRGLEPDRIVLINGGHNEKTKVELWVVPAGAVPPVPNPRF